VGFKGVFEGIFKLGFANIAFQKFFSCLSVFKVKKTFIMDESEGRFDFGGINESSYVFGDPSFQVGSETGIKTIFFQGEESIHIAFVMGFIGF